MTSADEYLQELRGAETEMGRAKFRTLVAKYNASLTRMPRFKEEVEAQLALNIPVDFEELVTDLEPALAQAAEFLLTLDLVPVELPDQADLIEYGSSLAQIATTRTVEALANKFHQRCAPSKQPGNALAADEKQALADAWRTRRKAEAALETVQARRDTLARFGYVDHSDGTVTDIKTHLMWKQCAQGQDGPGCSGQALIFPWDVAMIVHHNVNLYGGFAGYEDWRLPTKQELETLVFPGRCPAICLDAFPNAPGTDFWSSSQYGGNAAWVVNFNDGRANGSLRTLSYAVRLVRTGQ